MADCEKACKCRYAYQAALVHAARHSTACSLPLHDLRAASGTCRPPCSPVRFPTKRHVCPSAHLPGCTRHMTAVEPEREKSAPVEGMVEAAAAKQRSSSAAASSCSGLGPSPTVASSAGAAAAGDAPPGRWQAGRAMSASWLCISRPEARALRRCAEAACPARPCPSNTPMATAAVQQEGACAQPWQAALPPASGSARNASWLTPFQL